MVNGRHRRVFWSLVLAAAWGAFPARGEDWPMFRRDAARSAFTPERVEGELEAAWSRTPAQGPQPAWTGPDTRMGFDAAFHAVIAGGRVFFGSSANGKVYALDAETGAEAWSVFTGGPVRFAPAVWGERVFVASDDGFLYCLSAETGEAVWKRRGGPGESMVLGNGRMISRWPARGGPVAADGMVYFAAGIWPSEGIFLYALEAASGRVEWLNDESGSLELDQPHGGARAESGVSAQGYLAVAGERLLVPTGRAVPAAFDRGDGAFLYFHLQRYGSHGGWSLAAVDDVFFNTDDAYWAADGDLFTRGIHAETLAAGDRWVVYADGGRVMGIDRSRLWVEKETTDRMGKPETAKVPGEPAWAIEGAYEGRAASLILTGNAAVVGTEAGKVTVVDVERRSAVWTEAVEGRPLGLAFAEGRLYVSTDRGWIHCFGAGGARGRGAGEAERAVRQWDSDPVYAAAAEEIIHKTGVTKGYCVDLGCGDGGLAYELARRTDLVIYGIDADAEKVAAARERLDAAGLYGVRVTVHEGDPSNPPYPPYAANLVVSGRSVAGEGEGWREAGGVRVLRPFGGAACLGKPGSMTASVRGPLEGAGVWTHQYADAGNTACSSDALVKGPLGVLWFGDNRLEMPSRHGRGPAPLFSEGRLFVEGMHGIEALDAYNGTRLWEYRIPDVLAPYDQEHLVGTAATGSNMCLQGDSLYVRTGSRCLRLDTATGAPRGEFEAPRGADGEQGTWGFIGCEEGTLFGSAANEEHVVRWAFQKGDMSELFSESEMLFALDTETGEPRWTYTAERSIRHNAVAAGGGRVYLIDRSAAEFDRLEFDREQAKRRGETPDSAEVPATLAALDARTGDVIWSREEGIYGTLLALSTKHDVLLMSRQHTRFNLPSEDGGGVTGFRASTGEPLWEAAVPAAEGYRYSSRPVINDTVVYLEPGALDLLTGRRLDFSLARSYACGILSGGKHLLAFRSATLGFVDLTRDEGTENYGGVRPGCWINAIPAGGMLLVPDASARCTCSYLIKASVALVPME